MPKPAWSDMVRVFGEIGLLSFGGPAAQIGLMEQKLTVERPWLSQEAFLRALGFCTLLPGPEAMQLATYAGWQLRGITGGLLAGTLFVLPGALVVWALTLAYLQFGTYPEVQAAFLGIKATVLVIVALAVWRLSMRALDGYIPKIIAFGAFIALFLNLAPFPVVLGAAAALGAWALSGDAATTTPRTPISWHRTAGVVLVWGALWWGPLLLIGYADGSGLLWQLGTFFSWLAVVTFGGAYAVLAYMAEVAIETHGWLSAEQMIDGLGLAETTPGPLILVTLFVGALAGDGAGGLPLALAAAGVTLWATFLPCFLWIFAGAPYIERISQAPRLQGALRGITAAVVGVIGSLSVWFAIHVLFEQTSHWETQIVSLTLPNLASLSIPALLLLVFAWGLMCVLKRNLFLTLFLTAVAGLGLDLLT